MPIKRLYWSIIPKDKSAQARIERRSWHKWVRIIWITTKARPMLPKYEPHSESAGENWPEKFSKSQQLQALKDGGMAGIEEIKTLA